MESLLRAVSALIRNLTKLKSCPNGLFLSTDLHNRYDAHCTMSNVSI
jgi:hypothetical protein